MTLKYYFRTDSITLTLDITDTLLSTLFMYERFSISVNDKHLKSGVLFAWTKFLCLINYRNLNFKIIQENHVSFYVVHGPKKYLMVKNPDHLYRDFEIFESKNEQNTNSSEKPDNTRDNPDGYIFKCRACTSRIRIPLDPPSKEFKCNVCKKIYRIVSDNCEHNNYNYRVILIETFVKHNEIPKDVILAFRFFNLNDKSTFNDVKSAYRSIIKKYHPDNVSALGDEFIKMAEHKTKEINAHYSRLEKYFKDIS